MRLGLRLGLLCAASLAIACGEGWELDLTVRVPAMVQADYEAGYPAQLVVVLDRAAPSSPQSTGGVAYRIATLCSESSETLVFTTERGGAACEAPGYVRAWLEPRDQGAESRCGALEPPRELMGTRRPSYTAPMDSAEVFPDRCTEGSRSVKLTLESRR